MVFACFQNLVKIAQRFITHSSRLSNIQASPKAVENSDAAGLNFRKRKFFLTFLVKLMIFFRPN